jgi:hypothetical protein
MLRRKRRERAVADESNSSVSDRPPAEQGLADVIVAAFRLYRAHARPLLLMCALLFVPASLTKACVLSAIYVPAAGSPAAIAERARAAEDSAGAIADAYARNADPRTIAHLQREHKHQLEEIARAAAGPGRIKLWVLGVLATLVSALAFAVAVPLTGAAVTIGVADRLTGGHTGWLEAWMLLLGRLGRLLAAVIPAAGLIAVGLVFWVIPGLVVAFCFALVAQVAVIEGLGGAAALKRSVELVGADWLRVALWLAVFLALVWAARLLAGRVVPDGAIFMTELVGDLLTLAVMPLPLIAGVLLYFDLRKRRDNFGDPELRAVLASLRG